MRRAFSPERDVSIPDIRICPVSGRERPARILIRVVLPEPFGPIIATVSATPTAKSMPRRTSTRPKDLVISVASIAGRYSDDTVVTAVDSVSANSPGQLLNASVSLYYS